MIAEFDEVV